MSESQQKALIVLIQSVITAVLLFIQSFFLQSCMSAQGDINKETTINVPVTLQYESLYEFARDLGISDDDPVMQFLKNSTFSNSLNPQGAFYGN